MGQATLADTRPTASPGQVEVDDYVGRPAEEAGWLVRRLGLRPGMCQSFGCEPEQHGRVVAQQPPAGETTARNTFVDLYIGIAEVPPDSDTASEQREQSSDQMHTTPARASERRPRKTRRARTTTSYTFDTPPPPVLPVLTDDAPPHRAHDERLPSGKPGAYMAELEDTATLNAAQTDFLDEEILAASDLFTQGTNRPGTALRGPRRRVLGWGRRHPVLGVTLVVALGAWSAVALGVTRARPQAPPASRSARPTAEPRSKHRSPNSSVTARRERRTSYPTPEHRRAQRQTTRRTDTPGGAKATGSPRTTAANATARTASPRPTPAPSPSSGGPFSP